MAQNPTEETQGTWLDKLQDFAQNAYQNDYSQLELSSHISTKLDKYSDPAKLSSMRKFYSDEEIASYLVEKYVPEHLGTVDLFKKFGGQEPGTGSILTQQEAAPAPDLQVSPDTKAQIDRIAGIDYEAEKAQLGAAIRKPILDLDKELSSGIINDKGYADLSKFYKEATGYDFKALVDSSKAEDIRQSEIKNKEPRLDKQSKDLSPEDMHVRGETRKPFNALAIGGAALSAAFPEVSVPLFVAGNALNYKFGERGFAVKVPGEDDYFIAKTPDDVARLKIRLYPDSPEKLLELPYVDLSQVPRVSQVFGAQYNAPNSPAKYTLNRMYSDPTVFRLYSPKDASEFVKDLAVNVGSLGLQGDAGIGGAVEKSVGLENSGLGTVIDLALGIGLMRGAKISGKSFEVQPQKINSILEKFPGGLSEMEQMNVSMQAAKSAKKTNVSLVQPYSKNGAPIVDIISDNLPDSAADVPQAIIRLDEIVPKAAAQVDEASKPILIKPLEKGIPSDISGPLLDVKGFPIDESVAAKSTPPHIWIQEQGAKVLDGAKESAPYKFQKTPPDVSAFWMRFGRPLNQLSTMGDATKDFIERAYMTSVGYARALKKRLEFREEVKALLPDDWAANDAEKFVKYFDGRPIQAIRNAAQLDEIPKEVLQAAEKMTQYFNADRAMLAEKLGKDPFEFGIQQGYFPRIFKGRIIIENPEGGFVGKALTRADGEKLIAADRARNPSWGESTYKMSFDVSEPDLFGQLSRERQGKLIRTLAEESGFSEKEILAKHKDLITENKNSPFFLKHRTGAEKDFVRNLDDVMDVYDRSIERFDKIRPIKEEAASIIDGLKDRPNAQRMLSEAIDALGGVQAPISKNLDRALYEMTGGRVQPGALERWLGYERQLVGSLYLTTPRFALVNMTQPLQTLWPETTWDRMANSYAKIMSDPATRAELKELGILTDTKLDRFQGGVGKLYEGFRKKWPGSEALNQSVAYLSLRDDALALGKTAAEADRYARLYGQFKTQYMNMPIDRPISLRGPIASSLFQFQRFPLAYAEQSYGYLMDMLRNRNFKPFGKMVLSQMTLGGLRPYMAFETYNSLRESFGDRHADAIYFGLPGLLGLDLTASYNNFQIPPGSNAYEKIGRVLAGVGAGTLGEAMVATLSDSSSPLPTTWDERLANFAENKFPPLRSMRRFLDWADGDYDLRDAKGKLTYIDDGTEIVKEMFGFTGTDISKARDFSRYMAAMKEDKDHEVNISQQLILSGLLSGKTEEIDAGMKRLVAWQQLHQTLPIDIRGEIKKVIANDIKKGEQSIVRQKFQQMPKLWQPYFYNVAKENGLEKQLEFKPMKEDKK